MVAGPLFLLIFGIIEVAAVFIVSTTLENAMSRASRTIRTGEHQTAQQGQTNAVSRAAFMDAICDNMAFLEDHCRSHLSVDVRTAAGFSTAGMPDPVQNGTFNDGALGFQPGGEREIVVVRGFYRWPLMTPLLSDALSRLDGGVAVLTATSTFRNEPFGNAP